MISLFGSKQEKPALPRRSVADGGCPTCGADKSARMPSNGFGPTFKVMCGACGHVFEEVRRG